MEQVIAGILEKSLVGGAFLYLLFMFVTKFTTSQEKIVDKMGEISSQMVEQSKTLSDVSDTLATLDERVRKLEEEKK